MVKLRIVVKTKFWLFIIFALNTINCRYVISHTIKTYSVNTLIKAIDLVNSNLNPI